MNNVSKFPTKVNPEKVDQFLQSYTEDIVARKPEQRPKAVLVVEYYKDDKMDATIYNVEVGGQICPEIHFLVGILEMAKHRIMADTSMTIPGAS